MRKVHTFSVQGTFSSTEPGTGEIRGESLSSTISVPAVLGGPGVGTAPEELLLAAASSCYLITLVKLLANRNVAYSQITLVSEGTFESDHGLRLDSIVHRPTIVIEEEQALPKVRAMAEHAEHACMVSSALRGNVEVAVDPTILVGSTLPG